MPHVLIVDDSPTDLLAMRRLLEGQGHRVSVVETAQHGLEFAQREAPDLVLMDVVFQGMSGFQGTRKLARDPRTAHIPVIIISSKDQDTDRIWGLRQGAADYLIKPVGAETLGNAVREALARRQHSA